MSDRSGRLVIITGTGTSIGKTHLGESLIRAWRLASPDARIGGLKPIESGVSAETISDASRLGAVSSFHVKHSGYALAAALSPHLAAREEGIDLSFDGILASVEAARREADGLVLELPGGLFTPLSPHACNADLAARLRPDRVVLVVPDRLGALHDVIAATRAAKLTPLEVDGVVVVTPETSDSSTGRNAPELSLVTGVPVLAVLPRATAAEIARLSVLRSLAAWAEGRTR